MKQLLLITILMFSCVWAAPFGEYKYSKYLGIQQQLRTQQMAAARRQRLYNQNPTRNIRYQQHSGQYPNIERGGYYRYSNVNRYSPQYYQLRYGN